LAGITGCQRGAFQRIPPSPIVDGIAAAARRRGGGVSMGKKLEFYYDCSSPWTYLAFTKVPDLAQRQGAEVVWKPILVGGVFNTVNPSVYESRSNPVKVKARYYAKDLQDWARFYGLKIGNPTVFPVNSVKAMRGAFVALEHGLIIPYSRRVFESYWGDDRDISQDAVLREIVREVGLDENEYFSKITSDAYKSKLRVNTDELIERGGFGSPTMFVDGSMFFGNDRLMLVEYELVRPRSAS
jgi:2-hydroxychromene-2-carboxylate isomerase